MEQRGGGESVTERIERNGTERLEGMEQRGGGELLQRG